MISNSDLTIYHKSFNEVSGLDEWVRYNYSNVWIFDSIDARVSEGYTNQNRVEVRVPLTENVDISNFSLGDIIVKGNLSIDINMQKDLEGYQKFNIVGINNNNFGKRPHIHITGE